MSFLRRRTPFVGMLALAFACSCWFVQSPSLGAEEPDAAAATDDIIIKSDAPTADEDDGNEEKTAADDAEPADFAPTYGNPIVTRMRIGARVEAKGGEVRNIFIMVAAPLDCPEQEVNVVDEEAENIGGVEFRTLPEIKAFEPGARQMLITVPQLGARQTALAATTYEILTKPVYAPKNTATLKIPAKPDKQLKPFLSASPLIPDNDRKIKTAVEEALAFRVKRGTAGSTLQRVDGQPMTLTGAELADAEENPAVAGNNDSAAKDEQKSKDKNAKRTAKADDKADNEEEKLSAEERRALAKKEAEALEAEVAKLTDWEKVEALYDYVRTNVKYLDGAPDLAATQVLKDEKADCHGLSALFVSMCRTMKVPARMVWVDNHQYAEFYLEDEESGKGYWYPAQLAGTRAFGSMPTPMVVFQKGDNFRVPERRRERLRYATDHTTLQASSKHKPRVVYMREPL